MITERTLKKWRKEALETKEIMDNVDTTKTKVNVEQPVLKEFSQRILRLTQILLDQHLLRK